MMNSLALVLVFISASLSLAQPNEGTGSPIIDVHLHAHPVVGMAPPGEPVIANVQNFLPFTTLPKVFNGSVAGLLDGRDTLAGARTDDELMEQTLSCLRRYNITAVTSGKFAGRWKSNAPERIILTSSLLDTSALRAVIKEGEIKVLGEYGFQYMGLAPTDSVPMAVFSVAEEAGLPIGIHMGPGPPGTPFVAAPKYRARLSNPLGLEEVLVRYPELRLYVMHAGWPMLDEMVHMLYTYPQLYVDIGVIDWVLPRKEFYRYLQRLVEAGFGKRIMFGSDQMNWPDAIPVAIANIESAPFLSGEQKRDILYNNAVRFLRIDSVEKK
jgi:uncharacterized protein